jgi:CheY-like chemotaxis protein
MYSADRFSDWKPGILIVDDEPAIRVVLSVGLRRLGFPVWEAASGEEAVRLLTRHRDQIDVALLDVCMPGQDGPETLPQLQAIEPNLTCYFITGFAGNYTESELLRRGAAGVIGKPFRVCEVVERLCQQLLPSG